MERQEFYVPTQNGAEKDIVKRLAAWARLRRDKS
jgi:hypothetical protein